MRRALLIFFASVSLALYATPAIASAAACQPSGSTFLGLPTWYKYLEGQPDQSKDRKDKNGNTIPGCSVVLDGLSIADILVPVGMAVLEILFRIVGIVSVFMVIRGGFGYITSQGNPGDTKVAKDRIVNAFIGIAISLVATSAIVFFYGEIIKK